MDFPELPTGLLEAGREYHQQLRTLGLRPEGLLWVHDTRRGRFALWLVWSGIDRVGPLAITDLLFKAYRASALTQKIDPFIVEVRSLKSVLAERVIEASRAKVDNVYEFQVLYKDDKGKEGVAFQWSTPWIYHLQGKPRNAVEVLSDWRRFSERVDRLAA